LFRAIIFREHWFLGQKDAPNPVKTFFRERWIFGQKDYPIPVTTIFFFFFIATADFWDTESNPCIVPAPLKKVKSISRAVRREN